MARTTITHREFTTVKLAHVDNAIYNNIERKFADLFGHDYDTANRLLKQLWDKPLNQVSANSFVNIMDCFEVI